MRSSVLTCTAVVSPFLFSCALWAQSLAIGPAAGLPQTLGDGGPATSAVLWSPRGVVADSSGNLYIADTGHARIRQVMQDGTIRTVAGSDYGFSGDNGPALSAELSLPERVKAAPNGDIYILDTGNRRIRRLSSSGQITTVAGPALTIGGKPLDLLFPRDVAIDATGQMYIADAEQSRVFSADTQGNGAVVAGTGIVAFYGDGMQATQATLALPRGVAIDSLGNIYLADTGNNRIRKITSNGVIQTIAGATQAGWIGDGGPASAALLSGPAAIAVDSRGSLYIADTGNNRIRRIDAQGVITTIAGSGAAGFSGEGSLATAAMLNAPEDVSVDPTGNIYIADTGNNRIRRVSPDGIITTVAGVDRGAGDNGPAVDARLFQPGGVAVDAAGSVYIADTGNSRIRKITAEGILVPVAGTGAEGFSGDGGPATAAELDAPNGLAVDSGGNLYVADTGNHVIRKVTPSGVITTVAGTAGRAGNGGDSGPALSATLNTPVGVAIDARGLLYVADSGNNRIRVVDAAGNIQAVAGDAAGLPGFADGAGDGARFNFPTALAFGANGDLYIADRDNNRIRVIGRNSIAVTTWAGSGVEGDVNGARLQAQFAKPAGIAFDSSGNLLVADYLNDQIRMIGPNGSVQTVAGTGATGDSGDGGPAVQATLNSPWSIAAAPNGTVYFADQDNNRVRKLSPLTIAIASVANAASRAEDPIAPGEIITIRGAGLVAAGATAQVLFDGVAGPVLYSSPGQINVVAPFEVKPGSQTTIRVLSSGTSASVSVPVRAASPGIFTFSGSGAGQAASVNQDGSLNGASSPAPAGSVVSLYATGEGQTTPPSRTGQVATGLTGTALPVEVRIAGQPAQILYSGAAPGALGLMQINVVVPAGIAAGNAAVDLRVGDVQAASGVTIAVR